MYAKTAMNVTSRNQEFKGFGYADNKGREIGAMIVTGTVTFTPDESAPYEYAVSLHGNRFFALVQKTKAGKEWGAGQNSHYFKSESEMKAFVARRVATIKEDAQDKGVKIEASWEPMSEEDQAAYLDREVALIRQGRAARQ